MKDQQQPQVMTQQPPQPQMMPPQQPRHHPQMMMTPQHHPAFGLWPPLNPTNYPNPPPPMNPQQAGFVAPTKPRNWKGKKVINKKGNVPLSSGGGGYRPPTLNELQHQNRMKAKRFFSKKKFNNNNSNNRFAPYAPRNTTSFLIRAKKSGGIASLVSPCPVTPAVLPTPMFSPSREVLGDMAKEEWGVDGYGSMKGLIRLRSPGGGDEDDEEDTDSDSDVEEHVEVERRLDHDLSRFEMIYPSYNSDYNYNNVLENRVDDQDTRIAQLEEENLILKERLFLMEREVADFRRRMVFLDRRSNNNNGGDEVNEEVVDNVYDSDGHSMDGNNNNNNTNTTTTTNNNNTNTTTTTTTNNNNNNNDNGEEEEEEHGSYGVPEEEENDGGARDVCMDVTVDEPKSEVVVTEDKPMDDQHLGVEAYA